MFAGYEAVLSPENSCISHYAETSLTRASGLGKGLTSLIEQIFGCTYDLTRKLLSSFSPRFRTSWIFETIMLWIWWISFSIFSTFSGEWGSFRKNHYDNKSDFKKYRNIVCEAYPGSYRIPYRNWKWSCSPIKLSRREFKVTCWAAYGRSKLGNFLSSSFTNLCWVSSRNWKASPCDDESSSVSSG